ncbi:MAG: type II toxin-antitoxin system RelB/DinJ family antitoxin [Desulfovibrio sp.]|nr:type II toxin-antitoxin system RelB/DinJ family antitoxin [Desulfovibrio sp.]
MAQICDTYVRARIDSVTKARATEVLSEMKLSVSDAIRLLLMRVADERNLPFEIKASDAEMWPGFAEECRRQSRLIADADNDDSDIQRLMDETLSNVDGWTS